MVLAGLIYVAVCPTEAAALFPHERLWASLGRPILRTLVFISIGLLVGQLIEGSGWTSRVGLLARPIVRWSRLPDAAGLAFTMAFVSGVTANTMLYNSFQEGRLNRRGLVLANLLNASLPAYLLHMPTTLFIILPLTRTAGLYYVGLTLTAALLRFIGAAAVSRVIMPCCDWAPALEKGDQKSWSQVWSETWPKFITRLKRIMLIVVPVYAAVFAAAQAGFFSWLQRSLAGLVSGAVLPIEAMSVIVFSVAAEFTSGFAAAGALLESGSLSLEAVVLALLIGNVVATPVRALRHQLPHYMGIYSPRFGSALLIIGQTVRVASVLIVTVIFAWLY